MKYMFTVKTNENVRGYWCEFDYPVCFECDFDLHSKDFDLVFNSKKKEVENWINTYSENPVRIVEFSSCRSLLVF